MFIYIYTNIEGLCFGCTRSNKLVDLPDELAELGQLHTLRCKYNLLQRLPAVLARLPLLTTLVLFFLISLNLTACGVASLYSVRCNPAQLMCLSGFCSLNK